MTVTVTQLRKDVYRLFEKALRSGEPLRVTCKGQTFQVVPPRVKSFAERMKKRDVLRCDPEELVHLDWSKEWKPCI